MLHFCLYIFEKEIQMIYLLSIQHYQTDPWCWKKQRYAYRSTLDEGTTLLFTPPSKDPEGISQK